MRAGLSGTVVAVMAILAMAAPAFGQGFYYKEIRKDDRVYVFNVAANAARFEAGGELAGTITKPGIGPAGETIVADSARALQLYFFKHGISEVVPEPSAPAARVEWRDGKTRITTDQAYLEISNRVQMRYTHEDPDEAVTLAGTTAPGDSRGSFRLRRVKLKLEGWFWTAPDAAPGSMPKLSYELQLNWPSATASNPGALLEDAFLVWDPQGRGRFRVVAGQFKPPFGRQELTSALSQSFVDRALVSNEYARGRDAGVAVQGAVWGNKLEYRAGLFNGNGVTRTTNDHASFHTNARIMWQPNGSQVLAQRAWVTGPLYSEGDFESTTVPIYALGLNFEHNDFHGTTSANDLKSDIVGVDGVFKFKGLFATAEFFKRRRTPEEGAAFDADGGYLQIGIMLNRRRTWEAGVRYGRRDPNATTPGDSITEARGGINYYHRRHSLKFQADFGQVTSGLGSTAASRKDRELRLQAQFIF
jgi:hypothetical protein